MKYKELINRGFVRHEQDDNVWFEEYGYHYFFLEKEITKTMYFTWFPDDKKIELIFHQKGKIQNRRELTIEEFKILEDVFNRKGDILKEEYKILCA